MIYKSLIPFMLVLCNTIPLAYSTPISTALEENLPFSKDKVKVGEKDILLIGNSVEVGDQAPEFTLVDQQFKTVGLTDFPGKILLLNIVPSIDTGIGAMQSKHFDQELINLPSNVVLLTISTDTPFAQKRFVISEQVNQHQLLSDAVWREFGHHYGVLIKDMGILTRAIFIINNQGMVAYKQLLTELTAEPDYAAVISAIKTLTVDDETPDEEDKTVPLPADAPAPQPSSELSSSIQKGSVEAAAH